MKLPGLGEKREKQERANPAENENRSGNRNEIQMVYNTALHQDQEKSNARLLCGPSTFDELQKMNDCSFTECTVHGSLNIWDTEVLIKQRYTLHELQSMCVTIGRLSSEVIRLS